MSKPSAPFAWATAGARVAASLAKVAIGFVTRERPPAQILNDNFAQIGDWTSYLDAGAFEGVSSFDDDLSVAGDLAVTGAASCASLTIGGDVYGVRKKQVIPNAWIASGTAPTLVVNPGGSPVPVWKLPTAQTVRARLPYVVGETVTSVKCEVYGDGAVDWIANVFWNSNSDGTGGAGVASNDLGVTNQSAVWAMSPLTVAGSLSPMTSGGNLWIEIFLSGGTQLYLGSIEIGVKRLP